MKEDNAIEIVPKLGAELVGPSVNGTLNNILEHLMHGFYDGSEQRYIGFGYGLADVADFVAILPELNFTPSDALEIVYSKILGDKQKGLQREMKKGFTEATGWRADILEKAELPTRRFERGDTRIYGLYELVKWGVIGSNLGLSTKAYGNGITSQELSTLLESEFASMNSKESPFFGEDSEVMDLVYFAEHYPDKVNISQKPKDDLKAEIVRMLNHDISDADFEAEPNAWKIVPFNSYKPCLERIREGHWDGEFRSSDRRGARIFRFKHKGKTMEYSGKLPETGSLDLDISSVREEDRDIDPLEWEKECIWKAYNKILDSGMGVERDLRRQLFANGGRLAYLFDRSKQFFGVEKIPLPHAMQSYVDLNLGKDQLKEAVRKAQFFPHNVRSRQGNAWAVFRNFSKDSPERKLGQYITSIIGVLRMAKLEGTHTKVLGYMPDKQLPYRGESL